MGGRSLNCNQITGELWVWYANDGIWLSAAHIPGKENVLANKESREKRLDTEWKLNSELFDCIVTLWGTVSVDLFASRLNYQLKPFGSWRPEGILLTNQPVPHNTDCIGNDWPYGIIIVPMWNTQVWFPRLLHLLIDFPDIFQRDEEHCSFLSIGRKHTHFTRSSPFWRANYQEFPHSKRHFAKSCQSHIAILQREYT